MLYLLYKIGLGILSSVNTKTAYSIVVFCTRLKGVFWKRDKKIVRANLRTVLPEANNKKIASLADNVFTNFAKYLVDFFSLLKEDKDYLKRVMRVVGTENVDEALKLGNGCIILAGHFGNWELAGCAMADLGYKMNVIALPHADPRINDLFIKARKKAGVNIIGTGGANAATRTALRNNEVIAILGDRLYGDRGVEVEFFGKKATVPRGAALLSLRNNTPIVMAFTPKESGDMNTLIFEKPFRLKREGALDEQMKHIMQRFTSRFEYYIKKYPSQWYMFNNIWENETGRKRQGEKV
jgi:KDO2-lipid IV(A) lauroyltransferase